MAGPGAQRCSPRYSPSIPHHPYRSSPSGNRYPPMEIILNRKRAAARLRASILDNRHPVFRRLFRTRSFPSNTRLIHNHLPCLEGIEQTDPLVHPPWQAENPRTTQNICATRDGAGEAFQQWADTCPPLSMFLFTDGSRLNSSDASAGAGWYGYWGAWKQESSCGHLCLPKHEVFDAEATAAYEGLKAAINSAQAPYTQNLCLLLDNQEVARQLQGHPRGSSQQTIQAVQEATDPSGPPDARLSHPGSLSFNKRYNTITY